MDNELYSLISKAREACAGSNVQEIPEVLKLIEKAEDYITNHFPRGSLEFSFRAVLKTVYRNLEPIPGIEDAYGIRLIPDKMLCDILNRMLEEEE